MTPLFLALLILAAATLAFVASGFVFTSEPDPAPAAACAPPCVPLVQYQHEHRLAVRRLKGWRAANRRVVRLRARWSPTVEYAITLASLVYGIPRWQIESVATCESHKDPKAQNGRYRGVMQLGWLPFGLSPFDPIANVLSAAETVRHDGGWRQWQCKPG